MTVFLKGGYDKLTAVAASFGGLFLGYIGQITGTYGNDFLYQYLEVTASSDVIVKLVLFILAFILFSIFGVSHLKNNRTDEDEESDLYLVEEPKKIVKRSEQIMTWPTVVMAVILLVITVVGYIPWIDAFGITFFDKIHKAIMSFSIFGVKIFETLIGTTITANIAGLTAKTNARRAALSHTMFNVFGVVWMLIFFYPFITFIIHPIN